jgi:hypothetical protein
VFEAKSKVAKCGEREKKEIKRENKSFCVIHKRQERKKRKASFEKGTSILLHIHTFIPPAPKNRWGRDGAVKFIIIIIHTVVLIHSLPLMFTALILHENLLCQPEEMERDLSACLAVA